MEKKLMTVKEVREEYGIGTTRLYEIMKTDISHVKIGRRTYLKTAELDQLIADNTIVPVRSNTSPREA